MHEEIERYMNKRMNQDQTLRPTDAGLDLRIFQQSGYEYLHKLLVPDYNIYRSHYLLDKEIPYDMQESFIVF